MSKKSETNVQKRMSVRPYFGQLNQNNRRFLFTWLILTGVNTLINIIYNIAEMIILTKRHNVSIGFESGIMLCGATSNYEMFNSKIEIKYFLLFLHSKVLKLFSV